jgi:hypothetical protein
LLLESDVEAISSPSSWCVCRFRHFRIEGYRDPAVRPVELTLGRLLAFQFVVPTLTPDSWMPFSVPRRREVDPFLVQARR